MASAKGKRQLGIDKGRARIADDFDALLPPEILEGFYGAPLKELILKPLRRKKSKRGRVS